MSESVRRASEYQERACTRRVLIVRQGVIEGKLSAVYTGATHRTYCMQPQVHKDTARHASTTHTRTHTLSHPPAAEVTGAPGSASCAEVTRDAQSCRQKSRPPVVQCVM